jgi:hypothetical protein
VQYQKAFLETELVTGSTLQVRGLDLTKSQLQARTAAYLQERIPEVTLEKYSRDAAKEYNEDLSPNNLATRKALDVLHKEISSQELEMQRKAVETLRNRMQELDSTTPMPSAAPSSAAGAQRGPADPELQRRALELLRQQMHGDQSQDQPKQP